MKPKSTPSKFLLDSMIYDNLEDNELRELYDNARTQRLIEFISPHVTFDQLSRIPDVDKRSLVLGVVGVHKTVTTFGYVEGISRPGWFTHAPLGTIEKILGNQDYNKRNQNDALLAATANHENAILVTDDVSLQKRCKRENISFMNTEEFKNYLIDLLENTHNLEASADSTKHL